MRSHTGTVSQVMTVGLVTWEELFNSLDRQNTDFQLIT